MARDVDAAVHAAQLYIGCSTTTGIRDQQRLYDRMVKKIQAVANKRGMDPTDAYNQILNAAQARGGITPTPGKDI